MQKELEEMISLFGFSKFDLTELNEAQLNRLSQDDIYILKASDFLALDGKIKTERDELLIEIGAMILQSEWSWTGHEKLTSNGFASKIISNIHKLKELENNKAQGNKP